MYMNAATLNDKTILITGGTGSFGKQFVRRILNEFEPKKVIVFSRDELKQFEMRNSGFNDPRMRYFLGDVRDQGRLERAFQGVDIVIHAAALKQVPAAEYNPMEFIKTNVLGAENIINAALKTDVKKIVALSTDKAAGPINLYGATKLCSDKLFIAANNIRGWRDLRFSVVRYGNVMGSRGSVIPFFMSLKGQGELPITDARMTRFMISLEQGVELVWRAFEDMEGGEIYVKKIPSMKVTDIARVLDPEAEQKIVGIRPGEKIHEQMVGEEDAYFTYEYPEHYKILPQINGWDGDPKRIKEGVRVPEGFVYSSGNNAEWMTDEQLRLWIDANAEKIGAI